MDFGNDISTRIADPEMDIEYAYDLYKRTNASYVIALKGGWPEPEQYDFFREGFINPDTRMILSEEMPVGCFCITDTGRAVVLQRFYLEPDFQRRGIGRQVVAQALEKAHEVSKPLELKVLENNEPALEAYAASGFFPFGQADGRILMRHRDTQCYATPRSAPVIRAAQPVLSLG
jgi:GNAT superfamily N-acetyltransferase